MGYTLLTQSLASNDQAMFDRLLLMQNDDAMREFEGDLIKNTLDRISSEMAVQLLEKLTEKFRVSTRQSISILRWLLPLLNSHSASFSKEMSSRKDLISVHQAIDYQIKSLLPAMKLQGRLSLLMNQMDKVGRIILFNVTQSRKILEISHHSSDTSKDFTHVEGGHHARINSIVFDSDSSILTRSSDKKLCRWDLNGKLLHTLDVGEDIPSCLALTNPFQTKKKSKKYLMIAANHIHVWNVTSQHNDKQIGSFQGHASQTRKMRISEDNAYLISSEQQRFVYVWKCKSLYKKNAICWRINYAAQSIHCHAMMM